MKHTIYQKQVQLLVQVLPMIATESCFALKGGTAINLFIRDMPRLSVDIDLVYLPMDDREVALKRIREALTRISNLIARTLPGTYIQNTHEQSEALRLLVQRENVRIKIELSPVIRGTVFGEEKRSVCARVEAEFGYAEMDVVSLPDLYAGKICAALDRQHPRDLFDVKFMFENEGFPDNFRKTFLIYLISHQRPMAELLDPHHKDIASIYESEFVRMAQIDIPLVELERVREELITKVNETLTKEEKQFLISFKSLDPEWKLLGIEHWETVAQLPSVRWKQLNLKQMPKKKHQEAVERLNKHLSLISREDMW